MCRLLGYVAQEERSIPQFVGPSFNEFLKLSEVHRDGWGIARNDGRATTLMKAAETANSSSNFATAIEDKSKSALLHFRWATPGLGIEESNSHPFSQDDISFIHNGSIKPYDALLGHIPADLLRLRTGTTDSELFFLFTLSKIKSLGVIEGVRESIAEIKSQFTFSSLNAMVLAPHYLIVVCENNPENRPDWATDEYYQLRYRRDENGIVVASSGWDQSEWEAIPNHSIAAFSRKDFSLSLFEC